MFRLILFRQRTDGLMCYRDADEQSFAYGAKGDLAFAGSAEQIVELMAQRPAWRAYGSPTQRGGLFVTLAPGIDVAAVPLECGEEAWVELTPADLEEFAEG